MLFLFEAKMGSRGISMETDISTMFPPQQSKRSFAANQKYYWYKKAKDKSWHKWIISEHAKKILQHLALAIYRHVGWDKREKEMSKGSLTLFPRDKDSHLSIWPCFPDKKLRW